MCWPLTASEFCSRSKSKFSAHECHVLRWSDDCEYAVTATDRQIIISEDRPVTLSEDERFEIGSNLSGDRLRHAPASAPQSIKPHQTTVPGSLLRALLHPAYLAIPSLSGIASRSPPGFLEAAR